MPIPIREQISEIPHTTPHPPAAPSPSPLWGEGSKPLLTAANLSKTFSVDGKTLHAVNDISIDLHTGETLGIVGESGSGKSTLARLIVGLTPPSDGSVSIGGEPLAATVKKRLASQLNKLQMVFQNPGAALNRAQTVRRLIGRSRRLIGLSGGPREELRC